MYIYIQVKIQTTKNLSQISSVLWNPAKKFRHAWNPSRNDLPCRPSDSTQTRQSRYRNLDFAGVDGSIKSLHMSDFVFGFFTFFFYLWLTDDRDSSRSLFAFIFRLLLHNNKYFRKGSGVNHCYCLQRMKAQSDFFRFLCLLNVLNVTGILIDVTQQFNT